MGLAIQLSAHNDAPLVVISANIEATNASGSVAHAFYHNNTLIHWMDMQ
jgi:hypothetical protein